MGNMGSEADSPSDEERARILIEGVRSLIDAETRRIENQIAAATKRTEAAARETAELREQIAVIERKGDCWRYWGLKSGLSRKALLGHKDVGTR